MQLEDWLDDLCVRFIINLPPEELGSVERICFQVEEAQWFYEDFIRPLDPSLPSLPLKAFSLRIFQHCPLFSTWTAQHYTSAFAEFLAYKQRVPVRGAIMLNEDMDEVLLVKGWKKGANWSFPRGKINKDENDLDCAVREVYEETGFDIEAAGLVKPEKDMKYIEVTMREQHMRLYVFRGVPKDTYFEPKTRKEISKISWYKLTDLPTLKKKHAQQDAHDDSLAVNANKFYMVAPFLNPLRKWIAQQKKKEARHSSSHLAAPPLMLDESATEGEPGPATYSSYQPHLFPSQAPSSLPEVAVSYVQQASVDPSAHLKELLKIGAGPESTEPVLEPVHVANADAARSNALLSLLRSGNIAEMRASPHTPSDSISGPQNQQVTVETSSPAAAATTEEVIPSLAGRHVQLPDQQQSLLNLFAKSNELSQQVHGSEPQLSAAPAISSARVTQRPSAPYQSTGDPDFARQSPEESKLYAIPPPDALPKLTHHTRALLDAFKISPAPRSQSRHAVEQIPKPQPAPEQQSLLDMLNTANRTPRPQTPRVITPAPASASSDLTPTQDRLLLKSQGLSSNASSLLSLFNRPGEPAIVKPTPRPEQISAPVELAAGPTASPRPQRETNQSDTLLQLLRKDAPKREPQARKAGETAATVEGPLNQPDFERIARSSPQPLRENMKRSPVPAHRTLFDPKQPAPTKILQRADENRRSATKSPRPPKSSMAAPSPKQKGRSKPEKAFQPQILRRPQNLELQENVIASPLSYSPSVRPVETNLSESTVSAPTGPEVSRRPSHQSDSQKQNLLSLLTGQGGPSPRSRSPRQPSSSSLVSPLTQSQVASPLGDEPISTRSRMSSMASTVDIGVPAESRSKVEKRQTAAGDKAFLLGYLGRIASQERQAQ